MHWKPIKSKDFPLYKQISSYLETRILAGEFPPGSRLPSERELAHQLNVNRSTINIAFEELKSTGLVKRVQGVGTIVSEEGEQKRLPNWDKYVKEGFYTENNPLNQQIYQSIRSNDQVINFGIGELSTDLAPLHLLRDSVLFNENQHFGYEHIQGNEKLRQTISSHMKQYRNIFSTSSSVLITSGAQQAIHLIIRSLLKPGDAVAIEDPSYAYSLPIFHSEGLHTHLLPVHSDGIDPEQVVSLYKKHRIKMLFLNPTFQNPTGTTLHLEKKKRLLEICSKFGIAIVEDDPYSLTGYQDTSFHTLKSMDHEGIILYISSLSKIVASGLRIGWIIGPQAVIDRLTDVKQQIDFGQSNFPQWIANSLLNSAQFDTHIHSLKQGLEQKRNIMIDAFRNELANEIDFIIPEGGIHLWCKIHDNTIDQRTLFKEAIQQGVVFAPGITLGSNKQYLRFTYSGVDTHCIQDGIQRFAQVYKTFMTAASC